MKKKLLLIGLCIFLCFNMLGCKNKSTLNNTNYSAKQNTEHEYQQTVNGVSLSQYLKTTPYLISPENTENEDEYDVNIDLAQNVASSSIPSSSSVPSSQKINNNTDKETRKEKIICTYLVCYETEEFDIAVTKAEQIINKYSAYIEEMKAHNHGNDKTASMYVHVPTSELNQFLSALNELGTLTDKEKTSTNATYNYYDAETRIKTLTDKKERILKLLESAETIEETLKLDDELSECEYLINDCLSNQKTIEDLTAYTTVEIQINIPGATVTPDKDLDLNKDYSGLRILGLGLLAITFCIIIMGIISVIEKTIHFIKNIKAKKSSKKENVDIK